MFVQSASPMSHPSESRSRLAGAVGATVVVAVDSGPASYAALRWALREAGRRRGTVVAVNVLDAGRRADWRLERDPDGEVLEQQERLSTRVSRAMTEHAARTDRPLPRVQVLVVTGELTRVLERLGRDAAMLVLGRPQSDTAASVVSELAARHHPVVLVDEDGTARVHSSVMASSAAG